MNEGMYREIIIDHYKNPRNFGTLPHADKEAEHHNPLCGDEMKITVKLGAKKTIADINFTGAGCSVSRAGGSILTEIVKGKKIDELRIYSDQAFLKDMGVPITPARKKCALLALQTLRKALDLPSSKK